MNLLVTAVGLLAQCFFSARILVQWIMSEKARKVLSPTIFWVLSLVGSLLLFTYGWLRDDFAIILGQFISYYVYIWNLAAKGMWQKLPKGVRVVMLCVPLVAVVMVINDAQNWYERFFCGEVPLWLIAFGSAGQIIFTFRFVYQWLYSVKRGESVLPAGFWIISLTGSVIIVAYAIVRLDPVLILGQAFGLVAYSRNLIIGYRANKTGDAS
ncbi:MAG: lipid-A-disaccharide synthase N-terminal domain-containing protein [Muribaculum sp.]|nr:lipid-A-disaccharide synthase N-terminal domain-containing protein [Muribaculaceae bacterium]MCM1081169.1 lipid-A-disaccharide synthase N-terminal domain-containing protein [Muribaculum sp.]